MVDFLLNFVSCLHIIENMALPVGHKIRVRAFKDEILERIVVLDQGDVVLITREEEYNAALKEGRQPISVGFKKADVIPQ